MASNKITFSDKVGIVPKSIHIQEWWDDDVNEIKAKHNLNDDRITVNDDKISFDATSKARLLNTSGTNTGDQTLPITIVNTNSLFSTALGAGVSSVATNSNFFGQIAGVGATNASSSNFLGFAAGQNATNASNSNFFGVAAGENATSATGSNFFGATAGKNATLASYSNFLGRQAGMGATEASYSNFLGIGAGVDAIYAGSCNFLGSYAGEFASGAPNSNFLGTKAGGSATNAGNSNFFGWYAGNSATSAFHSNFFGWSAGDSATNAGNSNFFGRSVGKTFTGNNVGINNIIIGTNISLPNLAANSINLGGVLFGTGTYATTSGDPSIVPSATGKIGVGIVIPTEMLHVADNILAGGTIIGSNLSGTNTGDNAINTLYSGLVTNATHTGEVTGATTLTITANAVTTVKVLDANITNAKLANMATKTYKGRTSALTGVPEDVAVATLKTDLILVKADVGLGNVDNTSDLGKPVSTAQQSALDLKQNLSEKDAISGYAGLDGSGKINPLQLPALAITDTFVVATQVAMLALTAEVGDVAVRTDLNKSYILKVTGATVLANWQELLTPTDAVSSVFGRSGVVTAQSNDYTWNQVNKATSSLADVTTRNFSDLQNKPTTVAGYGITDVYIETEVDALDAQNVKLTGNQTIGGTKTFSVDAIVNGLTVGRGAGNVLSNTIVGDAALTSNTTGQQNTIVGYAALQYNTIGSYNTATGNQSLILNTEGSRNTANGSTALYSNTIGINNTVIGEASLYHNTTGSNNTALGKGTGWGITTGSNNTALGKGTGGGITTGSGNSIFGANVAGLSATLTNNIILANGTGAIKAQHDGTNWIFSNNVSASNLSGTNTGDQTTIVGITGTKAQFDTAVTDGNIMYIGDAPTAHTHTFASLTSKPTTIGGYGITDAMTTAHVANALIAQDITDIQNLSGTNTGDQDLSGLTTTLSQRDTSWGESYIQNFRSRVLDQNGEYFSNSAGYEFGKLKSQGWNNRPVLAMIPAAVKAGTLFSQLPANNVGDFTVVRNGTAHYANEEGLLKIALANVPRVNYSNGDGSLLTEPQATNLITYPISFGNSYWTKSGATIEGDPSTAGADILTDTGFDTPALWVVSAGATVAGSQATILGNGVGTSYILSTTGNYFSSTNGLMYKITYTVSSNTLVGAGTLTTGTKSGGEAFPTTSLPTTVGTHNVYIVCDATQATANFSLGTTTGYTSGSIVITDISIKEVQGYSAPSVDFPTSAFKLVEDTNNGQHRIYKLTNGNTKTFSFYVKPAGRDWIAVYADNTLFAYFDISNGVLGTEQAGSTSEITAMADGWYRCSLSNMDEVLGMYIGLSDADNSQSYQGDGTSGVYLFMAQLETGSVATSPTFTDITLAAEGSTTTRLADSVTDGGDVNTFNSTEGVLYVEMAALSDDGTNRDLVISDGTNNNRIILRYSSNTSQILVQLIINNASVWVGTNNSYITTDFNKISFRWSINNFSIWINGAKATEQLSGGIFTAGVLSDISYKNTNGGNLFYGNVKDLQVYNTALSDAELAALTTL